MNVKISVFNGIITLIGYICNMRQYIVDAFAEELFTGNPAAVLPCREMPSPELMLKIAIENNYSKRGGIVGVRLGEERVYITGQACLFMEGDIPFDL